MKKLLQLIPPDGSDVLSKVERKRRRDREYMGKRRAANPEREKRNRLKAYYANPEVYRACSRRWSAAHRDHLNAQNKERDLKRRAELLDAYGRLCVCCGETREAFLTLDHIGGGGGEHLRRLGHTMKVIQDLKERGWPKDKYRILCMNCNWATRFNRVCPHQSEREELVVACGGAI